MVISPDHIHPDARDGTSTNDGYPETDLSEYHIWKSPPAGIGNRKGEICKKAEEKAKIPFDKI